MKVWVIGGTSGIGLAVANRLEGLGHRAYCTGREWDVRNQQVLGNFVNLSGPFDGMVYSAGVNRLQWTDVLDTEDAADLYSVNVLGLVRALQAVDHKGLRRVVVVGSDAGWRPMRTSLAYCASKAALEMAVKVVAREWAREEFAINMVAPGMTEPTEMQEYIDERVPKVRNWTPEQAHEYEMSMTPLKRRARTAEVAEVICSVLLAETPYLNGAVIAVNGAR